MSPTAVDDATRLNDGRLTTRSALAIALVYAAGRVLDHEQSGADVVLTAELPERALPRFEAHRA